LTRLRSTGIVFLFTNFAEEAARADALEAIHEILAAAAVHTRFGSTFVDVSLAMNTHEAILTNTSEAFRAVVTLTTIHAGLAGARVEQQVAAMTIVTLCAFASVMARSRLNARGTIHARVGFTCIVLMLTVVTKEALRTITAIIIN